MSGALLVQGRNHRVQPLRAEKTLLQQDGVREGCSEKPEPDRGAEAGLGVARRLLHSHHDVFHLHVRNWCVIVPSPRIPLRSGDFGHLKTRVSRNHHLFSLFCSCAVDQQLSVAFKVKTDEALEGKTSRQEPGKRDFFTA